MFSIQRVMLSASCQQLFSWQFLHHHQIRHHHHRSGSILDFISIVSSMSRLRIVLSSVKHPLDSVSSPLVRDAFNVVDESLRDVDHFLSALDEDAVKRNDKRRTFRRYDDYPRVGATLAKIADVEDQLEKHLPEIRRVLSAPSSTQYISVSGKEYLIEIKCTKGVYFFP